MSALGDLLRKLFSPFARNPSPEQRERAREAARRQDNLGDADPLGGDPLDGSGDGDGDASDGDGGNH